MKEADAASSVHGRRRWYGRISEQGLGDEATVAPKQNVNKYNMLRRARLVVADEEGHELVLRATNLRVQHTFVLLHLHLAGAPARGRL